MGDIVDTSALVLVIPLSGIDWGRDLASTFEPGQPISCSDPAVDEDPYWADIQARDATFRIVVRWEYLSSVGLAALLRHELEHVRQLAHHPHLVDTYVQAVDLIDSNNSHAGRYYEIPMEADANSAASAFIRRSFPSCAIEDALRPTAFREPVTMLRAVPVESPSVADLPLRMSCFLRDLQQG
ncbi:MAG: hypothetical protein ABMA25_04010 [Ilumatobacteraceae bacterium]